MQTAGSHFPPERNRDVSPRCNARQRPTELPGLPGTVECHDHLEHWPWMHDVGAGWLMTSLSPSPLLVALLQAATTLPMFLLALPAGAMADIPRPHLSQKQIDDDWPARLAPAQQILRRDIN